jgi:gas vesicle protein
MTYSGRDAAKVAGLVVGGAAIGAALGLLYAPQSGVETRRQIKRYTKHYAKRAEVQALRYSREIKEGLAHAVESGKTWLAKKDMRRLIAV